MTKETKHTPGEWKALYFDALENDGTGTLVPAGYKKRVISAVWFDEQNCRCTQFLAEIHEQAGHPEQGEANAHLMAEAGTVASETGLTPRQLAEQREELLEALERMTMHAKSMVGEPYHDFNWIVQAEAAIARARGETDLAV